MHRILSAIGISKGKSFASTKRQKELLDDAAKTAWKMAKNIAANSEREYIAMDIREYLPDIKKDRYDFCSS